MKILIIGAGVQGTVFAVRLANAGHLVSLVSRPDRARELSQQGATIQDAETMEIRTRMLPVLDRLPADYATDLCLVTVRREQIESVLADLVQAPAIPQFVFLGNYANVTGKLLTTLGRSRTVFAFPGIAGYRDGSVIRYSDIPQQHTAVEHHAKDVIACFRQAGFRVDRVPDMNAWLMRHTVFITAMAGALYENGCDAGRLARDRDTVHCFIRAVREGWAALDDRAVVAAPIGLRTILCWVPLPLSAMYWSRLLTSRGDLYFARHTRHAPAEMASLAEDVRTFLGERQAPALHRLLLAIDAWVWGICGGVVSPYASP